MSTASHCRALPPRNFDLQRVGGEPGRWDLRQRHLYLYPQSRLGRRHLRILRQWCAFGHWRPVHNGQPDRVDAYRKPGRERHYLHLQDGHVPEDSITRRSLGGHGSHNFRCRWSLPVFRFRRALAVTHRVSPWTRMAGSRQAHPARAPTHLPTRRKNSQGRQSAAATVTLIFPKPSNLIVNVVDAQAYNNCNLSSSCIAGLVPFGDYRWIIEEDQDFHGRPELHYQQQHYYARLPLRRGRRRKHHPGLWREFPCQQNGFRCQGCTGPLSCEGGQSMLDTRPACTGSNIPAGCSATGGQHIRQCATLVTAPAGPIRPEMDLPRLTPARSLSIRQTLLHLGAAW